MSNLNVKATKEDEQANLEEVIAQAQAQDGVEVIERDGGTWKRQVIKREGKADIIIETRMS